MDEFRRAARGITKAGQIKGQGGRHEKDDRRRIDDRAWYVLGWSNKQKIQALLERAGKVHRRLGELGDERQRLDRQMAATRQRGKTLAKLTEFTDYAELDWAEIVGRVEDLKSEKRRIEQSSAELGRLAKEIAATDGLIDELERQRDGLVSKIGELGNEVRAAGRAHHRAQDTMREADYDTARGFFDRLAERIGSEALATPAGCDSAQTAISTSLTNMITQRTGQQTAAANRAVAKMTNFRRAHPVATADMDASMAAAADYRALHRRLVHDDLPRFEAQFKTYLPAPPRRR